MQFEYTYECKFKMAYDITFYNPLIIFKDGNKGLSGMSQW
jgi:hypothetical protein